MKYAIAYLMDLRIGYEWKTQSTDLTFLVLRGLAVPEGDICYERFHDKQPTEPEAMI